MNERIKETIESLDAVMSGILKYPRMYGAPNEQEAMYSLALATKIQLLTGKKVGLNPAYHEEWFKFCNKHKLSSPLSVTQVIKNHNNPTEEEQVRVTSLIKEWGEVIFEAFTVDKSPDKE